VVKSISFDAALSASSEDGDQGGQTGSNPVLRRKA
jgi:hypothetical protein